MHMVYDILVVDMIVCDTEVWWGCVLFAVPMKFMTSRTMFANNMYTMICMNMDYFITYKEYRVQEISLEWIMLGCNKQVVLEK